MFFRGEPPVKTALGVLQDERVVQGPIRLGYVPENGSF
jgi:hypothetical protein